MSGLSAIVLARDEADMLPGCLARLGFADEVVVVVDDRSTDNTANVATAAGARVLPCRFSTFAQAKQAGIDAATGEWILIVDADERVSPGLAEEVRSIVAENGPADAWRVPIRNWFLGQAMRHGGWADEHPVRLARRCGTRLTGEIHESIVTSGVTVADCTHPFEHLSHRSIHHDLGKTRSWLDLAAQEVGARNPRPVTARRLWCVVARELAWRFLRRQGWRDGTVGTIESLYQAFSGFAVLARLWEMQQSPGPEDLYRELEATL